MRVCFPELWNPEASDKFSDATGEKSAVSRNPFAWKRAGWTGTASNLRAFRNRLGPHVDLCFALLKFQIELHELAGVKGTDRLDATLLLPLLGPDFVVVDHADLGE